MPRLEDAREALAGIAERVRETAAALDEPMVRHALGVLLDEAPGEFDDLIETLPRGRGTARTAAKAARSNLRVIAGGGEGSPYAAARSPARRGRYSELVAILRSDAELDLGWDEMQGTATTGTRALTDADVGALRERYDLEHGADFSHESLEKGIDQVAHERQFHPVRDHLIALPAWDGESRIDLVPQRILGIPQPDPITVTVFRKWMISAASRAMKPGAKVDTTLNLVGPQGRFKSTFFRVLGEPWFSDAPVDLESKDGPQVIRCSWIHEMPELESIRGKEVETIKSFLSRQEDHYRPSYGRRVVKVPRSVVLVGTSNNPEILSDLQNRRWWIIELPSTATVDVQLARDWRAQLWAEALAAYMAGEPWWLDREQEAILAAAQSRWRKPDPWEPTILAYLERLGPLCPEVGTAEVLEDLGVPTPQRNDHHAKRVARILRVAGWQDARTRAERGRWRRPSSKSPAQQLVDLELEMQSQQAEWQQRWEQLQAERGDAS